MRDPVSFPPSPSEQHAVGAALAALNGTIRSHAEIARTTAAYRDVLAGLLFAGTPPTE